MRRRPAILLLLALALLFPACGGGDDDEGGTTSPGESTTTTTASGETADTIWYTDWDSGAVARWDVEAGACAGVTPAGLSADLIAVGLGWVWVTDCMGGRLVRLDAASGEVTGRVELGACPSAIAIAFDLVWLALPSDGRIVAVDPESGAIVAEGTSGLDTPVFLASGSLDVAGNTYYWKIDELPVSVGGGNDVASFKIEDAASTYTLLPGKIQGLTVGSAGGNDTAVLVGPPGDGSLDFSDPNYPTTLYQVGMAGASQMGDPLMGFYTYLGAFDGHYVAASKVTSQVVILNGAVIPVPVAGPPGPPVQGPPPPGGDDGGEGSGVWFANRDPEAPGLFFFYPASPPGAFDSPAVPLGCQSDGALLGLGSYAVLSGTDIATQAGLATAMDRQAFPVGPLPTEPIFDTTPEGPRFSSCSVGYESGEGLLNGMEGTTDPGATVVLSIEVGTLLYADLATAVAGDDGRVVIPDFDLDTLTTPIPPGATITVVYVADGNYLGACRLEVET
jgi:hypothetical protein